MTPENRQRFDALMKLSDFRFARWQNRRAVELKISYAFWAILAAAATLDKIHKVPWPWVLTFLIVAVLLHAFWIRTNWISNEMDIRTAFHFAEHAEKITGLPDAPEPEKRLRFSDFKKKQGWTKFICQGACQAQLFTSFFLCAALFLILLYF
jgi:hypothetical protein